MCCTCKNMFDPSENNFNTLTGSKIEEVESTTISSSFHKNSYFQNIPTLQTPSNNSRALTNDDQFAAGINDALVPMLSNDGKVNIDETNYPINFKESSLPAPINQYAIDRFVKENYLQKPIFEQRTNELDTIGEFSTISIPYTTTSNFDYDDSRNYLSTNKINKKNTGKVNISAKCGKLCDERSYYSSKFSGMQTETKLPVDYDEFGKSEQESKKDYYDEVVDERNTPIAFSPYSRLKRRMNAFTDINREKFCQFCDNSNIKKTKLLKHNAPNEMTYIAAKSNHQKALANILKSKIDFHVAANNTFNQVKNANNNNHGRNFFISDKNQNIQNLTMRQHPEYPKMIDSLEEFRFRSPNHTLLRLDSMIKEPKDTMHESLLKFNKQPNNKNENFLIKSFKLIRVEGIKNRNTNEDILREDDSYKMQNLTMKISDKELIRNISAQIDNDLSGTNNLQFLRDHKKPKQKKSINDFFYHIQKPESDDIRNKFRNNLVFEMQRDIWPSIITNITEKQKKLTELPSLLITPNPIIGNTSLNSSILQQILIKKIKTKRPIQTRKAKVFDF
ncbi:unnamed protein product [Cercopithifilaria johnstoni]|uniref:Uncharacterized protein n=1 Tax=Cercopithifilaria johnstoni TaxID=2874296 RepID=A0A8J2MQ83_9BILA|nr:unnamed protein product [Cercopithifilaria johnstoni]